MLRWFGYILLTLLVVGAGAYYWLIVDGSGPTSGYTIDMAEVRSLANSIQNDKPTEIRIERIAAFKMPLTVMIAGESWNEVEVPVYSYQVAFPASTVVIDTAIDGRQAAKDNDPTFDAEAFARMQQAMKTASTVVITHEHPDHIGGIAAYAAPDEIRPMLRLTTEQVANAARYGAFPVPAPPLFEGYTPLAYEGATAIAPGVVLMKAPGHTPGSQLVYVRRADGRELLFIGDIGWSMRNVETGKGRPRLLSDLLLGEDRTAVFAELAALAALHEAVPDLRIVPGHDTAVIDALVADGTLLEGFEP